MGTAVDYPVSYYAATANAAPNRERLAGNVQADVCVVGGGFTGVSAALHLAERGFDVVLLESSRVGWGASGRNGGQVGTGQRRDVFELEAAYGRLQARTLWDLALEATDIVAERIRRHDIACDYRAGNMMAITKPRYVAGIAAECEHLLAHYGYAQLEMLDRVATRDIIASDAYCGARLDHGGGHLHPLNFVLGMAAAAEAAGASIFEHSRVSNINWGAPNVVVTDSGQVRARYVLLCTNAYLDDLEATIASKVMPITNHVIATEPLGEAGAKALIANGACVHATKFVVDYYRCSADHRLVFGGGETYSDSEVPNLAEFVRRYMVAVFPQLADVGIDYAWSGRLAITANRLPAIGRLPHDGFYAHGFSGHGVALTQLAGKLMAEAIAGTAERFDVMSAIRHHSFPGGTLLRKPLLVLAMLYYALRDRL